ncbi:MAG: alanine racemase [Selenomonadales bacterium]|nr:alanine racemase [Selenomonadales bacterium]
MYQRPVWAEIDLGAIASNVRNIKKKIGSDTMLCAIVKADAYGHGTVQAARTVLAEGADYLAVAVLREAQELRHGGITAPILILGATPLLQARDIIEHDVEQTIFSLDMAKAISDMAVSMNKVARVHIKIDTGMMRVGIRPEETGEFVKAVMAMPNIKIQGIFSHFAMADARDKTEALAQLERFREAVRLAEQAGADIPIKHIANSAAILDMPEAYCNMVRAGIILYGLLPSDEVSNDVELRPAMTLKAEIMYLKEVAENVGISYGHAYHTTRPSRIATLPVGYADGWSRRLTGKADVTIGGKRVPIVGRICMDQCMVDVTDLDKVEVGDEVVLFGEGGRTAEEVAEWLDTISYEVICMIGKRVPRQYIVTSHR